MYSIVHVQVLVMAGQLKRDSPHLEEDIVLIRALRDSNLPKFLADDAILFRVCTYVHACAVLMSTYVYPPHYLTHWYYVYRVSCQICSLVWSSRNMTMVDFSWRLRRPL